MNSFAQYLHLLRYHLSNTPLLWIIPVAMVLPIALIPMVSFYRDLSPILSMMLQLWWMPFLLVSLFFGSSLYAGNNLVTPQTVQMTKALSDEFILTRAVDRSILYWSKISLYWLMMLSALFILILTGLKSPQLSMTFSSKETPQSATVQHYARQFPDSKVTTAGKHDASARLVSPTGSLRLRITNGLLMLASSAVSLIFILGILPRHRSRWWFWTAFILCIASSVVLPLLFTFRPALKSILESGILWIQGHLLLSSIVVLMLAVVSTLLGLRHYKQVQCP